MFLVTDAPSRRHEKIRKYLPGEPVVAILLATIDFEWTIRRAIIALGTNSNTTIKQDKLRHAHGPDSYKKVWKEEVQPRFLVGLAQVVKNWSDLQGKAFEFRNRVVHGDKGMPSSRKTAEVVEIFLQASTYLHQFAEEQKVPLFGKRLPVRRHPRTT